MTTTQPQKHNDIRQLDELTGGAFTAPTSGERSARVREWLAKGPSPEQLQEVFKELSGRDKGAAKPGAIDAKWTPRAELSLLAN